MIRFFNTSFKLLARESVRTLGVLLLLVVFAVATYAFQEPASGPPAGGSVTAPVNTGNVSQTKAAGLTIQGLLWGNSVVSNTTIASPQYCIGVSCITAWSQAGGGGSGTVTSVGTNNGLVGGTITTSGTIGLNITSGFTINPACTNPLGSGKLYWDSISGRIACGTDQLGSSGSLPAGTDGQTIRNSGGTWVANSTLYNNGTNVGIGTAGPGAKLHIEASSASEALRVNTGGPGAELIVRYGGSNEIVSIGSWSVGGLNFYSTCCGYTNPADGSIVLFPRTGQLRTKGDAWFATVSGNVGIGTTAPGQKLDVVGGYIRSNTGFCINASCITSWPAGGGGLSGSGSTNYISKWTGGTSLGNSIIFDTGSRVGIGTAAPLDPLGWASSLDVAGGMTASRYYDRQNTGYFVDLDAGANLSRDWLFGGSTVIEPSWDINTGVYSNRAINTGSTMSARDVWLTAPNFGSPRWASAPATGGTGLGAWEARSQGTTYTAATDGFVTATLDSGPDQGLYCKVGIETPQGIRRQWSWPNGDSPQVAMMSPVRRGDTYYIGGGFCPAMAIYWIPLGN
ncbi:MAG: hypothetical protein Q7R73_00175 [bacterium]|nr:hypothetical protein [bacterium]